MKIRNKVIGLAYLAFACGICFGLLVFLPAIVPGKAQKSDGMIVVSADDIDLINSGNPSLRDSRVWVVTMITTNRSGLRMASVKVLGKTNENRMVLSPENLTEGSRVRLSNVIFATEDNKRDPSLGHP